MNGWQQIERNLRSAPGHVPEERAVKLPANCTLWEIGGLCDCLRSGPQAETLDGSAVVSIDAAGIRLLSAFIRERRAAGCEIQWRAVSPVLTHAVGLLGPAAGFSLG